MYTVPSLNFHECLKLSRQQRVSKTVLIHSKGSVSDKYLAYIGLRGSVTAHCTGVHPPTLSLWLSKEEDGTWLGHTSNASFVSHKDGLTVGGTQMGIEVEEDKRDLEKNR